MANNTNNERRSIIATIKRWFGNKAELANDAMDSSVSVEVELEREIKRLKNKYDEITKSDKLASLRGAALQTDDKLKQARKKYDNAHYESKIKTLMAQGNETHAMNMLEEKEQLERDIEELKETKIEFKEAGKQIEEDLNRLERDIKEKTKLLEKLKVENAKAEQTEEMYKLMNEITSLTSDVDTSDVQRRIDENKRRSYGTRAEYDRSNTGARIDENLRKEELKSRLEQYK